MILISVMEMMSIVKTSEAGTIGAAKSLSPY